MINPFEWHHSLYYGEKRNLKDFDTKNPNSLDALLKQMYMEAHKSGRILMKNSLPAFNAAYYVAVCLSNIEGIDETNLDEDIENAINTIWQEDYNKHHSTLMKCPDYEQCLIEWMVLAILHLQENKSEEMNAFLESYRNNLARQLKTEIPFPEEDIEDWKFLNKMPDMIDSWQHTYNTDLRPHALMKNVGNNLWYYIVHKYSMDELELQLTFFRTEEEQKAFLNWAKEMSQTSQSTSYSDADDLPF